MVKNSSGSIFLFQFRLLVLLGLLLISGCSTHGWQGPVSEHFDGKVFYNPGKPFDKGIDDLLRYTFTRDPGEWQKINPEPGPPPPKTVAQGQLRVTPINHASVLIQADDLNLLTDPIFSLRASPVGWLGPKRYRPPAIRFEDLPKIDVVIISHNHYDHMDLPTLKRLYERDDPVFVVPLGDYDVVTQIGSTNIVQLDWWQSMDMPNGQKLWGAPCVHWSGRMPLFDRNRSLWLAYVIETAQGPVYFGGDTGFGEHFAQAHSRFGDMRLALLPIGAYEPRWLVGFQHMDPTEAVKAHKALGAQQSIGMHYGTFELSDVGQDQPLKDLLQAAESNSSQFPFTVADFGMGMEIAPLVENNAAMRE